MKKDLNLITTEIIERKIYLIRGVKVMLDSDIAKLYRVPTKVFNQSVKRNKKRFPRDFMFRLTLQEFKNFRLQFARTNLRSQIVTSSYGGRRYLPLAFTEQGVAMLSSVLNSERAVQVNIAIVRAFVRLRELMATHKELAGKIIDLEKKYGKHDKEIQLIFQAIKQLIDPPVPEIPKEKLGFEYRGKK